MVWQAKVSKTTRITMKTNVFAITNIKFTRITMKMNRSAALRDFITSDQAKVPGNH